MKKTQKIERIIRKRDTERKLKRFGPLAKIATNIVFSKVVYNCVLENQSKNKMLKKFLVFMADKFKLGYGL